MKTFKKWLNIFSPAIVLIAIIVLSKVTGLQLCSVQSGSMEPGIPTGSICLINSHYDYDDLQKGDIIVYDNPQNHMQIIHRIIAMFNGFIVTKGDANPVDDGLMLTEDNVKAIYVAHVPYVGKVTDFIRSPAGLTLVGVIVIGMVVYGVVFEKKDDKKTDENEESKG